MGMSLGDYVVTEAGFGADLGAEKFFNIKCVSAGLKPKALVLVATIRALRHHGGASKDEYNTASLERVERGFSNLRKHIENCKLFGLNPIVAINGFPSDTQEEIDLIIRLCGEMGVKAVEAYGWAKGGGGMTDLAQAVVDYVESGEGQFKALYDWNISIKEKIEAICTKIYGADNVIYSKKALLNLKRIERLGLSQMPVCMAKTQKSLSDNEKLYGAPTGFEINIREFEYAAGAGFVIPILGAMMRMPGLPSTPASEQMNIDDEGNISGLS
jgi:formate--tetrahydrofolate ligase